MKTIIARVNLVLSVLPLLGLGYVLFELVFPNHLERGMNFAVPLVALLSIPLLVFVAIVWMVTFQSENGVELYRKVRSLTLRLVVVALIALCVSGVLFLFPSLESHDSVLGLAVITAVIAAEILLVAGVYRLFTSRKSVS